MQLTWFTASPVRSSTLRLGNECPSDGRLPQLRRGHLRALNSSRMLTG